MSALGKLLTFTSFYLNYQLGGRP